MRFKLSANTDGNVELHNGRDGVSNHRRLHYLLKPLHRRRSKKTSKVRVLAFVKGIHRWPVNSLHKGPVTRKLLTFDDVIMVVLINLTTWFDVMWPDPGYMTCLLTTGMAHKINHEPDNESICCIKFRCFYNANDDLKDHFMAWE